MATFLTRLSAPLRSRFRAGTARRGGADDARPCGADTEPPCVSMRTDAPNRWWPVDRVILTYFAAITILEIVYWQPALIAAHIAATALLWLAVRFPATRVSRQFHFWYPLPYILASYKEMAILIPIVRSWTADQFLARLDFQIWHANPTVWLERWQNPVAVELLEICYMLFVPAILVVAALLWRKAGTAEFRQYAFLIALGFLVSYVGYLLVPARGPRFLLAALQTRPIQGLWLTGTLQALSDRLESAHYDCFPSGHTELTILAWWGSRSISRNLSRVMCVYLISVILATVYLRYHYTVDVFAGMVVAWVIILVSRRLYSYLSGGIA
jgi:membrane-associated phospholipid phosphatase